MNTWLAVDYTNQEESRRLQNMLTKAIVISGRVTVLKPWMGHVCEAGEREYE